MAILQLLTTDMLTGEAQRYFSRAVKRREPIREPRLNERVRTFRQSFSLSWEEFEQIDQREFVSKYARTLIARFPKDIEEALGGRSFRYFRFDVDADTDVRKTFVIDEDPVYVAICFHRTAVLTHPQTDGYQDEVVVQIRADVQAEAGDPDPPVMAAIKREEERMKALNVPKTRNLEENLKI